MKTISLFSIFFFILSMATLTAQTIENWITSNEKNPVEKIYLHTDAEFYFQNDTIWFKVYLTDSRSGQLIPRAENVYVNILDESGAPIVQSVLLCLNGQVAGQLPIPLVIKPGSYLLQAFTDYLMNFSPEAYFTKRINISRISGISSTSSSQGLSNIMIADVQFLPEGGILLENATNLVAFKAINKEGFGVFAQGNIKDEKGVTVVSFNTEYNGMGLFFFHPEPGKTYYATVSGFPRFRPVFEPVKSGIKIQLVNNTSKEVIINIAGNSEEVSENTYYLVNMHRGEVQFYQSFTMDGINKVLKFNSSSLKPGINKLVLLNSKLQPLSERLLFSKAFDLNEISVAPDTEKYALHQKVQVTLSNDILSGEQVSNLSVSVLNTDAISKEGRSKNILSQFLVDSEINGYAESSADLFADTDLSSEAKIRLIMLTHGWSSYFWNSVPKKTEQPEFKQNAGIDLKGNAWDVLTEKPVSDGEITIIIQKDGELAFLTQQTDKQGNFTFPGLLFNDTAFVQIQAKNDKGKQNTNIELFPIAKNPGASEIHLKMLGERAALPENLQNFKYESYTAARKYAAQNRILRRRAEAPETNVVEGTFQLYETADFTLEIEKNEESFENVLDFMVGKVPGVDISGNDVAIRGSSTVGGSSTPLFLIDGVPIISNNNISFPVEVTRETEQDESVNETDRTVEAVKAIPINDVARIDILKSPQNLALFGINGANGVIAIYTRAGNKKEINKTTRGVIEKQIVGYSSYKKFYSPKYTPQTNVEDVPDFRTTLFWEPEITTVDGKATVEFFTSGQTGKYRIFVEGITDSGRICLGAGDFEVLK